VKPSRGAVGGDDLWTHQTKESTRHELCRLAYRLTRVEA